MLVRLKAYRWFILGIAAAVLALGGAAQAGVISPDIGSMASLAVGDTAFSISDVSPEPAVSYDPYTNTTHVWVRGSGGGIWHRENRNESGWGPWEPLSFAAVTSAPSTNGNYIYVRGSNNAIYVRNIPGRTLAADYSLPGYYSSGPAVTTWPYRVFARGSDNSMYVTKFESETLSWRPEYSLSGQFTSGPAVTEFGGYNLVFGRGTDNALWFRPVGSPNNERWESLSGQMTSAPAAATTTVPYYQYRPQHVRVSVFTRGIDNAMWYRVCDLQMCSDPTGWAVWQSAGGGFTSGPGAAPYGRLGEAQVIGRGVDGKLWRNISQSGDFSPTGWVQIP